MTVRPSSQELADLVRESLYGIENHVSDMSLTHPNRVGLVAGRLDEGHAALDALEARLQATEQALREIKNGRSPTRHTTRDEAPRWVKDLARRALEEAAE